MNHRPFPTAWSKLSAVSSVLDTGMPVAASRRNDVDRREIGRFRKCMVPGPALGVVWVVMEETIDLLWSTCITICGVHRHRT